jgi:hypothetical protein
MPAHPAKKIEPHRLTIKIISNPAVWNKMLAHSRQKISNRIASQLK